MENFYVDRLRSNSQRLQGVRDYFTAEVSGRRCIIVGSAPDPIFPCGSDDYLICINGSVYSAYKYLSAAPNLTYLNSAIFRDRDNYANATCAVLAKRDIGDVLMGQAFYDYGIDALTRLEARFRRALPLSKFDKRIILGQVLGRGRLGIYRHRANVSNGIFMSAFALWCGASEAVLVGFSFNSGHVYNVTTRLSPRGHIEEDALYLRLALSMSLDLTTTSRELHEKAGLQLRT